ncbi:hypothetical protein CLDAP_34910 [Caldilinea aerophila DSM 14535 = NBRC 104270]|uniref:Uncharacterized protein n=1 Tax=Caldilinea aerophila (strain DSM 14535 / JCM 11387 / NBRC 104270 / STL-6-O1) TaxID=926550 RepID=I0I8E3_CALAS|nr:hypothetical protein CLDAP_34910 [Caldilinea aerophila DSM 14535 = NBRC 104270]
MFIADPHRYSLNLIDKLRFSRSTLLAKVHDAIVAQNFRLLTGFTVLRMIDNNSTK